MEYPFVSTLKNNSVNLRPEPGSNASYILLDKGDTVLVFDIVAVKGVDWCRVLYEPEDIEGYILAQYLAFPSPSPTSAIPSPTLITPSPVPVTPSPNPKTNKSVVIRGYRWRQILFNPENFDDLYNANYFVTSSPAPVTPSPIPIVTLSPTARPTSPSSRSIEAFPVFFCIITLYIAFFVCIRVLKQRSHRKGNAIHEVPPAQRTVHQSPSFSNQPDQNQRLKPIVPQVSTPAPICPPISYPGVEAPNPPPLPRPWLFPESSSSEVDQSSVATTAPAPYPPISSPGIEVPNPPPLPRPWLFPESSSSEVDQSSVASSDLPPDPIAFSNPSPGQVLSQNQPYTLPPSLPPRIPKVSQKHLTPTKSRKKPVRSDNYNPEPESATHVGSLPIGPVTWPRHDTSGQTLAFGESERLQNIDDRLLRYRGRKIRSKKYIGRDYERFIGYLLESNGFSVFYNGARKGVQDGGIDLIASKGDDLLLIQCKLYRRGRNIPSGYVYRLKASVDRYCQEHPEIKRVSAYLVTNYAVSAKAQDVADTSGLYTAVVRYDRYYPCIKCVSFYTKKGTRRSYYYMPWQSSYDKVCVLPEAGDCYVFTAQEAECLGYHYLGRRYNG